IWVTNVIIFALWYWALDHGGPASKGSRPDVRNDFLYTQQQPAGESCLHPGWSPGFIDYLFLAFLPTQRHFRRLTRSRSPSGLSF
ncbi:MAG: hypothetical protein WCF56_01505, partial [Pseudolabrys sp.]